MERKPIPSAAWVLCGATVVAVAVLAMIQVVARGEHQFFSSGDPRMFLLTTRDLFGAGHGFAALGRANEIPYRYGRMGLPLAAWLLAFGQPSLVGWTLIGVNLVAVAAVPALAVLVLNEYGAPPVAAAAVLVLPAYLVLYGNVVSDPLVIALLVLSCLLDARKCRRTTLIVLAFAILVKEIALLALLPLLWRAARRRDWRSTVVVASAALPYAVWCVWLRWRVGEFPFLAQTRSRTGAIGLPFVGFFSTMAHPNPDSAVLLAIVAATILVGVTGAWRSRSNPIGTLAAIYTLLTICLGTEALRFFGEALRVLLVPQVFGALALVIGARTRTRPGVFGGTPIRSVRHSPVG